jgi:hypothetical protein
MTLEGEPEQSELLTARTTDGQLLLVAFSGPGPAIPDPSTKNPTRWMFAPLFFKLLTDRPISTCDNGCGTSTQIELQVSDGASVWTIPSGGELITDTLDVRVADASIQTTGQCTDGYSGPFAEFVALVRDPGTR